jgi:hypothetical protein
MAKHTPRLNAQTKNDSTMRRGVCGLIKGVLNLKRLSPTRKLSMNAKLVFALAFGFAFQRST